MVSLLAGCSSLAVPMPYMPNFTISKDTQPLPPDYLIWVRDYVASTDETEISPPQRLNSWSIYEAAGWYVCTRTPQGKTALYALASDRVAGRIANPDPKLCGGLTYSALAQV
ncbi:MAG TPA: hypothetical protein VN109_08305 [Devosia sp.]|jgi:hypothetical protein|nr:hypothetical protein [Devosia sp.]